MPLLAICPRLDAIATRKVNGSRRSASGSLRGHTEIATTRAPQLSPETPRGDPARERLCLAGVSREASRTDQDRQVVGRGATALKN